MPNWWDSETPVVITSDKNALRWYPQAKKMQVSRPDWTNQEGEQKPGKTVTFDVGALGNNEEAKKVFASMLEALS